MNLAPDLEVLVDVLLLPLRRRVKGVGKVYVQVVVVDVFCSIAFAKFYISKMSITAYDLLYDRVLPFYNILGLQVGSLLTDNGRESVAAPTAPLRPAPGHGGYRAPHHQASLAANQRLRGTHEPHAARRELTG